MKTIKVTNAVFKRLESFRLLAQLEKEKDLNLSQAINVAIDESNWVN